MNNTTNNTNNNNADQHAHICVKCGKVYVHAHKGGGHNHGQFAFQCPYSDCEWYSNDKPAGMTRAQQKAESIKGYYFADPAHLVNEMERLGKAPAEFTRKQKRALIYDKVPTYGQADRADVKAFMREEWSIKQTGKWATQAIVPGSYTLGIKEAGTRKVFHTDICLNERQLKYLQAANPAVWFITGDQHHDHPVSHITTQLATHHLVDRVVKDAEGLRILDLHGNPRSNLHTFGREGVKIDTVIEKVMPKDYIRATTKWGDLNRTADQPQVYEAAARDFTLHPTPEWAERIASYDKFISIHTLYYYSREEIASLLSKKHGSTLQAIVHHHKGESGELADGEQTWYRETIMGRDHIVQENVMTLETYSHPSLDWLFSGSSSWHNDTLGFGWTLNKIGNETYLATFTGVPVSQCRMDVRTERANVDGTVKTDTPRLTFGGKEVLLPNVDVKTSDELRLLVAGKARTAQQFKEHVATSKRKLKNNKVTALAAVHETIVYSFFADLESDRNLVTSLFASTHADRRAFATTLKGVVHSDQHSIINKVLDIAEIAVGNHTNGTKMALGGLRLFRDTMNA